MGGAKSLPEATKQATHFFFDVTGTLTVNSPRVVAIATPKGVHPLPFNGGNEKWVTLPDSESIHGLLLAMAMCTTAIPDGGRYEAATAEDAAIATAASVLGVSLAARKYNELTIIEGAESDGKKQTVVKVLASIYISTRRRSSFLLQVPGGKNMLYTVGADSVVLPLCVRDDDMGNLNEHVNTLGVSGGQILTFASKELSSSHEGTIQQLQKQQQQQQQENYGDAAAAEKLLDELEEQMTVIGAVGVKDPLQDAVPSTIQKLKNSEKQIWVLSSIASVERSLCVAFDAGIVEKSDELIYLHHNTDAAQAWQSDDYFRDLTERKRRVAIVCPAADVLLSLEEGTAKKALLRLLENHVEAVVTCATSPLEKAKLVQFVKEKNSKAVTLAMGDGPDDVPMLQAADIKVGIAGLEGRQAELTAKDGGFVVHTFKELLMAAADDDNK